MCQPFSCLLLKDSVVTTPDQKHESMIAKAGLKDDSREPDFVRVEITPPDHNYAAPVVAWVYRVDQDYLPEWYVKTYDEERARKALVAWHADNVQTEGEQGVSEWEFKIAAGTCQQTVNGGEARAYGNATQTVNGGVARAYDNATQTVNGGEAWACGNAKQIDNRPKGGE